MDAERGPEASAAGIWRPPLEPYDSDRRVARAQDWLGRRTRPVHPVRWLVLAVAWSTLGLLQVLGQFGLFGREASLRSCGDWALAAMSLGCGVIWLGLWRADRRGASCHRPLGRSRSATSPSGPP